MVVLGFADDWARRLAGKFHNEDSAMLRILYPRQDRDCLVTVDMGTSKEIFASPRKQGEMGSGTRKVRP